MHLHRDLFPRLILLFVLRARGSDNVLEVGPKILKVAAFPSLRYVLTTRWDKPDEGDEK